jgi:hypothetical protein
MSWNPNTVSRGTLVEKLPDSPPHIWYTRAVWASRTSWGGVAPLKTTHGDLVSVPISAASHHPYYIIAHTELFITEKIDKILVRRNFDTDYLRHSFYLALAEEWLTDNFPQAPIRFDDQDWIVLSEDDLALAEVACPDHRGASQRFGQSIHGWGNIDAGSFYCPYIPLMSTSVCNPSSTTFVTRYGLV